jgi:phenylacetate-CoA ligase
MPLIRYDMGDLVRPSDRVCACGRAFPVVEKIIGRDGSSIRTPGGLELGASAIECILARVLYAMYEMPVETGRVVLEEPSRLVLEYVPAHGFTEDHEQTLRRVMGEQTPEGMRSEIRRMDRLDRTPRGKFVSFVMAEHH